MAQTLINLEVNGKAYALTVDGRRRLLDVLREDLHLTGTKEGCSVGECGACTVILNGKAVNSCLVLAAQASGGSITTVEGLAANGELDRIQQAFIEKMAVQCGFCTPGMLLAAKALLDCNPNPTREEIKEAISGVLCRCTGYEQVIQAVASAAKGEGSS